MAALLRRAPWPLLLAPLFTLLVVSRQPDVLLHASFWAEDGWKWYPDAYTLGVRALWQPWTGYLQTISRLVAWVSLLLPLADAPALFASVAIAVEVGNALFLVSDRLAAAWPSRRGRLLMAVIYLALPDQFETYANLTNTQWHLGLLGFLLLVSRPPPRAPGVTLELALLALSALSGPLVFFLLPVALWTLFERQDRQHGARLALIAAACCLQAFMFVSTALIRLHFPLGASPRLLSVIVAGQVVLGPLLGRHSMDAYRAWPAWRDGTLPLAICAAGLLGWAAALRVGPSIFRKYSLFAGLAFAACLRSPMAVIDRDAWPQLALPDMGNRYFLLPSIGFVGMLLVLAGSGVRTLRVTGVGLLLLLLIELPGDWHLPTSFPMMGRTDFGARARIFAHAPVGTIMRFPVRPIGWRPMVLTKR